MTTYLKVSGRCPICEKEVIFRSRHEWLRDHFFCSVCGSIPRERALMQVIAGYYPNYRDLKIHESSPGGRGVSLKLHSQCDQYSASHFYSDQPTGTVEKTHGYRCENLESLTFDDNDFDLFITQDVMEHVYEPEKAFKEIARVIKPGGAHIFTLPIINKANKTERWAHLGKDGAPVFLREPEYHGNPINPEGSPVTMHWGFDIVQYIMDVSGMPTTMITIDDLTAGIRAEFIEVLVSKRVSA
jgi:SAM-dependent methyltransferase